MPEDKTPVAVEPTLGVVQPTPNADGVAQTTPITTTVDAEALEKVKAEYSQQIEKLNRDLNQQKSSLQKQANELQRTLKEREKALKEELRKPKLPHMDGNERKTIKI